MMTEFLALLQTAIWPVSLVVFFWPFRKVLSRLTPEKIALALSRVQRGKVAIPGGAAVEWELAEQQTAAKDAPTETALPPSPPVLPPAQVAAADEMKAVLGKQVEGLTSEQRLPVLLDALVRARLHGTHEYVYNRIFGSQIAALERLRGSGGFASEHDAREFLKPYQQQNETVYSTYSFERWAGFLVDMGLVLREGAGFRMTPLGLAFLDYIEEAQLSKAKPF
jgi:hypothetical protein